MARRKERVGGVRIDPEVERWRQQAARNPAAMTAKERWDVRRTRAVYDLAKDIQSAVKAVARKEDTSASQVAEMLLAYGLAAYAQDAELRERFLEARRPARTPRFSWNLEVPEAWMATVRRLLDEENGG